MTRLMRGVLAVALMAIAAVGLGGGSAQAHSELISVTPADGAVLDTAPPRIRLVFNEKVNIELSVVEVTGPDGASAAKGAPTTHHTTVEQVLVATRPAGVYTLKWKVVSADGHPVSGSSTFTTRSATGPTETAAPPATPSVTASQPSEITSQPSATATTSAPSVIASAPSNPSPATSGRSPSGFLALGAVALVVFGLLGFARTWRRGHPSGPDEP